MEFAQGVTWPELIQPVWSRGWLETIQPMWNNGGKNNNNQPIWEWFIPPIYGDLGDGWGWFMALFYNVLATLISKAPGVERPAGPVWSRHAAVVFEAPCLQMEPRWSPAICNVGIFQEENMGIAAYPNMRSWRKLKVMCYFMLFPNGKSTFFGNL